MPAPKIRHARAQDPSYPRPAAGISPSAAPKPLATPAASPPPPPPPHSIPRHTRAPHHRHTRASPRVSRRARHPGPLPLPLPLHRHPRRPIPRHTRAPPPSYPRSVAGISPSAAPKPLAVSAPLPSRPHPLFPVIPTASFFRHSRPRAGICRERPPAFVSSLSEGSGPAGMVRGLGATHIEIPARGAGMTAAGMVRGLGAAHVEIPAAGRGYDGGGARGWRWWDSSGLGCHTHRDTRGGARV